VPLSNAERQARWRAKRNALALQVGATRNAPLDILVADRPKRGVILPKERRLAVQRLLKSANPKDDAELLAWLRSNYSA
jgi:hypothetical protein